MKFGESKEVVKLANYYIRIVNETKNWWKGYIEDCIKVAKKEIGEKYDENMEDGNKHR
tara:strand:+ start:753 stop:926 length:174 start_codon:yes stop_codon:yes gene_type:complete